MSWGSKGKNLVPEKNSKSKKLYEEFSVREDFQSQIGNIKNLVVEKFFYSVK